MTVAQRLQKEEEEKARLINETIKNFEECIGESASITLNADEAKLFEHLIDEDDTSLDTTDET
ncbi:hypothetical protein [Campylobacter cuniculorum]|uniref:Uncharacterized protein n=2 Tax=Campylobacter cuniculorum TaxID=374106 RepID=A0A1W6BYH3_9BACT|nr:hypothetical protein [Campylobacter cuniculorum]ARJ57134.1 hypothetical protein CCUN_1551 [Campylobacter cuniculorum DSM 23162 = LMG 24588]QOR04577.1 hypothetical protein A0071_01090 [Campylobacter cuniculorum]